MKIEADPENVKTAEKLTEKRHEKYGDRLPRKQLAGAMGFAMGFGAVVIMHYVNSEIISGSGGGDGLEQPLPVGTIADVAVMLV